MQRGRRQQHTVPDQRRHDQHPPVAETTRQPGREQGTGERARPGTGQRQPDRGAGQVQFPRQEQQVDRHRRGVEELERGRRQAHGPQRAVPGHETQTLADPLRTPRSVTAADPGQRPRRPGEEDRRRGDRERRREQRHHRTAQRRATDLGRGPAALDRTGPPHQIVTVHQPDQAGLIGDVEEHRQRPDHERHHQQHRQPEPAEQRDDGCHAQDRRPAAVRQHHHVPRRPPVHPGPGDQREQQQRRLPDRPQHPELVGSDAEGQDGEQRQDHQARLLAPLRRGLPHPETTKIRISPQTRHRVIP